MSIVDGSGAVKATYNYDPYGNVLSATGDMAEVNPLRYRGYYYDTETTLYYLQSRYYDPEIGRFLNADSEFDGYAAELGYNLFAYCANNPIVYRDASGTSITLTCVVVGAVVGFLIGSVAGAYYADKQNGLSPSDGWAYWKYVIYGGVGGGALGGLVGWAFAGTKVAASISWAYYKATTVIGTSSYAIGRAFEEWFYKAYNVVHQQVRYSGYRFDAVYNNSIVDLKNYDWSKYSHYSGLIKSFVHQASNYMQFIGEDICGQIIEGVTFCFSSRPPQEVIDALRAIGVTVNWIN
jgi:RHS repeat-associated protein